MELRKWETVKKAEELLHLQLSLQYHLLNIVEVNNVVAIACVALQ